MSTNPEIASLTRWLGELSKQVRDLAIGNPLNHAEVVNAAGRAVLISQLAFGSVAATDVAQVDLNGGNPAPAPGGAGWFGWGPAVWVYVTGGKLRVDVAAALHAQGNKTSTYLSYGVYGPTPTAAGAVGPLVTPPAYDRSVMVFDPGVGQGQDLAAGTFGLHSDLAPGWYYVQAQYAMAWSGGMFTYGNARDRRLLATPF